MANQLTNDGLTVGSGTITNFIPAFGSNVVGAGAVTVTVPSSNKAMPTSPTVGTVYTFNVSTSVNGGTKYIYLPSGGRYCYSVKTNSRSSSEVPPASAVSGSVTFPACPNVSGGSEIASVRSDNWASIRVGGGLVRVD